MTAANSEHHGTGSGAAQRRRQQRRRADARHAQWLIGLVQAKCSHHSGAGTEPTAGASLQLMTEEVISLRRQLVCLRAEVAALRDQGQVSSSGGRGPPGHSGELSAAPLSPGCQQHQPPRGVAPDATMGHPHVAEAPVEPGGEAARPDLNLQAQTAGQRGAPQVSPSVPWGPASPASERWCTG